MEGIPIKTLAIGFVPFELLPSVVLSEVRLCWHDRHLLTGAGGYGTDDEEWLI